MYFSKMNIRFPSVILKINYQFNTFMYFNCKIWSDSNGNLQSNMKNTCIEYIFILSLWLVHVKLILLLYWNIKY